MLLPAVRTIHCHAAAAVVAAAAIAAVATVAAAIQQCVLSRVSVGR
jgi:hypothetical protein